jgi:hypothetical protein
MGLLPVVDKTMAADHFSVTKRGSELAAEKPEWQIGVSSQRGKDQRII